MFVFTKNCNPFRSRKNELANNSLNEFLSLIFFFENSNYFLKVLKDIVPQYNLKVMKDFYPEVTPM